MSKYTELAGKLKSGEYDGSDIMAAWIALEESENNHTRLVEALQECVSCFNCPEWSDRCEEIEIKARTLLAQLDGEPK